MKFTRLSSERKKRADALESLVKRRIVGDEVERVNLQVATLLAILARPSQQMTVHRHGAASPHRIVSIRSFSHVVHELDGDQDVITPNRDVLVIFRSGIPSSKTASIKSFSFPGRTWHDMIDPLSRWLSRPMPACVLRHAPHRKSLHERADRRVPPVSLPAICPRAAFP